jgi:hypothetical protein
VYEACCVDDLTLSDPAQFSSLVVREAQCSGEKLCLREFSPRVIFDRQVASEQLTRDRRLVIGDRVAGAW